MRQKKQKQFPLPQFLTFTSNLTTMVIFDFEKKEEFEDTKGVIRFRISKKNRQRNGQKKKVLKDKQRSTKLTTIAIQNLQHTFIVVIYKLLPCMELIFHNTYVTLEFAVCIHTLYKV